MKVSVSGLKATHSHKTTSTIIMTATTTTIVTSNGTFRTCSGKRDKRSRRQLIPAHNDAPRALPEKFKRKRRHSQRMLMLPAHVCLWGFGSHWSPGSSSLTENMSRACRKRVAFQPCVLEGCGGSKLRAKSAAVTTPRIHMAA
jgi:hypothetical protein